MTSINSTLQCLSYCCLNIGKMCINNTSLYPYIDKETLIQCACKAAIVISSLNGLLFKFILEISPLRIKCQVRDQ